MIFITACSGAKKISNPNTLMLGSITKKEFKKSPYKKWFNDEYVSYKIDKQNLDKIKDEISNKDFLIYFGSWCSDSRREVPRFIKIMDYLDINYKNVHFTALDRSKSAPNYDKNKWNILYVPTFIILSNGREIGRIIETPEESLELDLVKILQ